MKYFTYKITAIFLAFSVDAFSQQMTLKATNPQDLQIQTNKNGVFLCNTNSSLAYRVVPASEEFHKLLGVDLPSVYKSRLPPEMICQYVPSAIKTNGEWKQWGYTRYAGNYAVLMGEKVTLTHVEIDVTEPEYDVSTNRVFRVYTESVSMSAPDLTRSEPVDATAESPQGDIRQ